MSHSSLSSASDTQAQNRLFRIYHLLQADINFNDEADAPEQVSELLDRFANLEGIDFQLSAAERGRLEDIASGFSQASNQNHDYEAALEKAYAVRSAVKRQHECSNEATWMFLNSDIIDIIMGSDEILFSRKSKWDGPLAPSGGPARPLNPARPDFGLGFAVPSGGTEFSWRSLLELSLDPAINLHFSPQNELDLVPIYPFCIYEAKDALNGTIDCAQNEAAVGVATALNLLLELAKKCGEGPDKIPPLFMVASQGFFWSVHVCMLSKDAESELNYEIWPILEGHNVKKEVHLFHLMVVFLRIKQTALNEIKPWIQHRVKTLWEKKVATPPKAPEVSQHGTDVADWVRITSA